MSEQQTVNPAPTPSPAPRSDDDEAPEQPGRRRRRRYVVTVVVLVVVVGGAAGATAYLQNREDSTANSTTTPVLSTASIERGDVDATESVDGKLTYPNSLTLPASATGVVTWVPKAGAQITRGKTLYKVANKPVTLFYGTLPLYRTLEKGVDKGPDVAQLERNLKALGYGHDLTVDSKFTAATKTAVKNWQEDRGLSKTGSVDATQVQYEAGPVRVGEVSLQKGGQSGGAAMTVTATSPIVQVALDASKQDLVRTGMPVGVLLPNGKTVKGKITSVGTVATTDKNGTSTIEVDVSLSRKNIGHVDEAPVSVDLVSERARNVLSVPIEALLGLREGGFGVQVVEGTGTRIVPVRTGTYGSDRVEVTGDGLAAGMKVEVPSS